MAAIIAIGQTKERPSTPTLSIPVDALGTDGVEPEVGDDVEHSFKGRVKSIRGDMATIEVTALDGEPVEGSPEEESEESPEEESSEEESEGSSNPGPRGRRSNPGPNIPGLPPAAAGGANPLAAALGAPRAKARRQTAAMGAALRRRARGKPIPLM
jgi:hypothetical protein